MPRSHRPDDPGDPGPRSGDDAPPPPPSQDPREVLRRTSAPKRPGDGPVAWGVADLLEDTAQWLDGAIRRKASATGLAADDIYQALHVRLLRSSTRVARDNPGVRGWLSRALGWTVTDLLRARGADIPQDPATLGSPHGDDRVGDIDFGPVVEFGVDDLVALGLSANQAAVLAMRCSPHHIPLKEFAQLVRRTEAAVRQDSHRGLRKLESLFGLTSLEAEVVRTWRRCGSTDAASTELGLTAPEVRALLDQAHKKIDRLFADREGRS